MDQNEGLLDRVRLNIGGYYYDVRHRGDLFSREGFPLNYLFKKKWGKYLMKDRTGRIYIDTEPCVFLSFLKWIEEDIVEFRGIYWEQMNRFIQSEFFLKQYVSAKISGLEHITNIQTESLIALLKKRNLNCSQLQQIASINVYGSIDDEKEFMDKLADQENVLLIFWSACKQLHALISDRALFLGRKTRANSHISSNRFYANLSNGKFYPIQSSKIGNGVQVLPIVLSTNSVVTSSTSSYGNFLVLFPPDSQQSVKFSITKIESYTFLPYSSHRGGVLTPVPLLNQIKSPDPSINIEMNFNDPNCMINAVHDVCTVSTEVMKAYRSDTTEIKHLVNEILYIGLYYEWIWVGSLTECRFTDNYAIWEANRIDEMIEIMKCFQKLKDNISNILQNYSDKPTGSKLEHDQIVSFNVEGERLCLLKRTIEIFIPESVLAIRVSGRWTEHTEDLDEEGSIYIDFPKEIFKPLVQALRQSSYFDRARIDSGKSKAKPDYRIPMQKESAAKAMFDYYQIPESIFTWILVPKTSDPLNPINPIMRKFRLIPR